MTGKRILTAKEKTEAEEKALQKERAKHPGAIIKVVVEDETDEDGKPKYGVVSVTESEVPPPGFKK